MGSTKVKGFFKGLKHISQIFEDEKESEMKIGFPTDVKHVAHIGWDGPSVEAPNWMRDFNGPNPCQSQPLNANGEPKKGDPEVKWVSEDSCRKSLRIRNAAANNVSEMPRSTSRRHSEGSSASESKPRHSKKNVADGSKPSRHSKDSSVGSEASSVQNQTDAPKKTRRKKSKDGVKESEKSGSKRSSRSKAKASGSEYTSPYSDPGPGGEFVPELAGIRV